MNETAYPHKQELCLMELLKRGSRGLHPLDVNIVSRTQANQNDDLGQFWTMTLSTDISMLIRRGIGIIKRPDPFISKRGYRAKFKRYWLADREAAENAISLVNSWRVKRGALPLSRESCDLYLADYSRNTTDKLPHCDSDELALSKSITGIK